MSDKSPTIYVATTTGVTTIDGERVTFQAGTTRVHAGHPLLKAVPGCFELLPADGSVYYENGKRYQAL
jgi:hypothetical protein